MIVQALSTRIPRVPKLARRYCGRRRLSSGAVWSYRLSGRLDFVLHGIEEFTAITIMSDGCSEIRARIVDEVGRGVTIYKGRGGKTGEDREIVYCVVTRLEIGRVMRIVDAVDPNAFVVQHPLANVRGGVVRRPALA